MLVFNLCPMCLLLLSALILLHYQCGFSYFPFGCRNNISFASASRLLYLWIFVCKLFWSNTQFQISINILENIALYFWSYKNKASKNVALLQFACENYCLFKIVDFVSWLSIRHFSDRFQDYLAHPCVHAGGREAEYWGGGETLQSAFSWRAGKIWWRDTCQCKQHKEAKHNQSQR